MNSSSSLPTRSIVLAVCNVRTQLSSTNGKASAKSFNVPSRSFLGTLDRLAIVSPMAIVGRDPI